MNLMKKVNLCTWNVRGFNDPVKASEVKHLLQVNNVNIIALLETRVKIAKFPRLSSKLGRHWSWENNYSLNPRGRIWLGWQQSEVDLSILHTHEQFLYCVIRDRTGDISFFFTAVYGLHTIETRKDLWHSLVLLLPSVGSHPWLLSGDFNSLLSDTDRINGSQVSIAETKDFNEFILTAGLCPLQSVGHYFSWHKGSGDGKTASRIDWGLGNAGWIHKFSGVPVQYLNSSISDHSPLLVNCLPDKMEGGKPFRFLNYLADHSKFASLIENSWGTRGKTGSAMFSLWSNLNLVKHKLKALHSEEFAGIKERIEMARSQLEIVQTSLQTTPSPELFEQERTFTDNLRKWLRVDEISLRQKSRIQWLQVGDSNHHFFFSSVKERNRQNRITVLFDDCGNKLVEADAIQGEIVGFYKKLLGSAAQSLPAVHIPTLRSGSTLSIPAKQWLSREVTTLEIDQALKGIGDDKAPGLDGFNAVFFKRTWHVIKADVYKAVLEVFRTNTMLPQFNCTSITLVPKVPNPSKVKDFRPIACCTVIYKLVAKILTTRMQSVIGDVVNEAQSGFIPGRQISDNILLATELIKGYTRTHISPRCLIKVDLKKAYDSIEWSYLKSVMVELGFPVCFVRWVFTCISTVSYSILINGKPSQPFRAKKGLRQGDPMSPFLFAIGMEYLTRHLQQLQNLPDFNFHPKCEKLALTHLMFADDLLMFSRADTLSVEMLFAAFNNFSRASGLEANLDKSNIYIGGVSAATKAAILDAVHIPEGQFPFRYLGVPLSTKKLVYNQCRTLIDKVVARAKSWTARHLSYAGRLQLVQAILLSLQAFWCQIFILPKKVLKEIQNFCRIFLWTGLTDPSKRSLVAWHSLCLPRSAGGWNLKEMGLWNKAAVSKLLWALTHKKDRLWSRWVHTYYIKNRPLSTQWPATISWSLRKILDSHTLIDDVGGWDAVVQKGKFSIKLMYKHLLGVHDKVPWKRVVCNNKASPKSVFITWLALWNRLPTRDRLLAWKIVTANSCPLCSTMPESTGHLFFECSYSAAVWGKILQQLQFHRNPAPFDQELAWILKATKRTGDRYKLLLMFFSESVYGIWLQRNEMVFNQQCRSPADLVHDIQFRVACRATDSQKLLC